MTQETKQQIAEAYLRLGTYEKVRKEIGYSPATISKVLKEYNLGRGKGGNQDKQRKVTDEQILEDIALGLTRQEIADKRGIHVANLDRRMQKLGAYAQHKRAKAQDWHYTEGAAKLVEKYQGEQFDFVSYMNGRYRLRCKKCGTVVERSKSTVKEKKIRCKKCYETEQLNTALLVLVQRVATTYYSSPRPQRKKRRSDIRKRCRHYGVNYEPGITLEKVYERDKGVCQICGKPTNWHDNLWHDHFGPLYPTIDHITALSNGGEHSWNNVQLAHAICNSYKRDLSQGELETMLFPVFERREQSA